MIFHSDINNVVVYTAITNNRDTLKEPKYINNFKYICFSDRPVVSKIWEYQPIPSGRYAYRKCKILVMKYFSRFNYSIWQDGSMVQTTDLTPLLNGLYSTDIAMFPHRARNNVYDEVDACIKLNKYDINALTQQGQRYKELNFASNQLFETGIIIRRHTEQISKLGEIWWDEVLKHTPRDQISLPYALWRMNMPCDSLVGSVSDNAYFDFHKHNL